MANKTIKTFEMNFATADGKSKKISLRHAKADITKDQAKAAMATIVGKDIFTKDAVDQCAKEKTANYVTRTVEEVYKAEA